MKLAAQRGAGGLLIRTMEANMTDTGIQEHCVWSLQHLTMRGRHTRHGGPRWWRRQSRLRVPLTLGPGVPIWAVPLAADDLREALAKAGAVTRVIDALKGFPGEKRVQQGGAWAINNFSANGTRLGGPARPPAFRCRRPRKLTSH